MHYNITNELIRYTLLFPIFIAEIENDDIDAAEQTVYACSGSTLVLQCGENTTSLQYQVSKLYITEQYT